HHQRGGEGADSDERGLGQGDLADPAGEEHERGGHDHVEQGDVGVAQQHERVSVPGPDDEEGEDGVAQHPPGPQPLPGHRPSPLTSLATSGWPRAASTKKVRMASTNWGEPLVANRLPMTGSCDRAGTVPMSPPTTT